MKKEESKKHWGEENMPITRVDVRAATIEFSFEEKYKIKGCFQSY